MTQPSSASAEARIAEELGRLIRLGKTWRAAAVDPNRHPHAAAHFLLLPLAGRGPMRTTALAECTHTDTSTVSRHVALLLAEGYVERQADPHDGRASILVLTGKGHDRVAQMRAERDAAIARLLAEWSPRDRETLARLLARFNDRFETTALGADPSQEIA